MKGNAKPKQEIAWPSWTEAKNRSHFFSPIQKRSFHYILFRSKSYFFRKAGALMYHRERILETSTLSCNEEEEEITKPPKR
jgi:hypothetical protein